MPFKQYVRAEIAAHLDETYRFEDWAADLRGRDYYDVHVSVIEEHETCVPTLRRVLDGTGKLILESGCGTGRWMAFFERLGHVPIGVDDSAGALGAARAYDGDLRLVRGDIVASPFRSASFDVVFSSYVAEHFEAGPDALFAEIHRLLKPAGLLLLVVPYDNLFRRLFTDRALQAFYLVSRLRGRPLAFTEHRFSRAELTACVERSGFRVEHVEPDDFRPPWAKGLSLDLGPLVRRRGSRWGTWEMNAFGRALHRVLNAVSPWICAAGILVVARKNGERVG
jgi:SAM-dependent methyltransferase